MPYCSKCGVEVDDATERCPLCSAPIQRLESERLGGERLGGERLGGERLGGERLDGAGRPAFKFYPERVMDPDAAPMPLIERLKIALEVVSVFLAVALAVVVLIDLLYAKRITWSVYPAAAIAYLWLCLAVPVFLAGRSWLVFAVLGSATLVFVFLLDAYDGSVDWFLTYGLPITLMSVSTIFAVSALSSVSKRKGLNVAAYIFLGAVAICAGIDLVVNLNASGRFTLSWSMLVALILVPGSALLLYFHFRVTKKKDLRKVFHI
jgi:hypothetical protein